MADRPALSPEDRLVLTLLQDSFAREAPRLAGLLTPELAWPLILRRARVHGIAPLLHRSLSRLDVAGVPPAVSSELASLYYTNAVRNLRLAEELARLLRAFDGTGIPALPLKGVALAESLYGDPALRVCGDLDILVPRRSVPRAMGVILAQGYEPAERHAVGSRDVDLLLRSNIEQVFGRRHEGRTCLVELHWDIAWRWQGDGGAIEDLWAEASPTAFGGAPTYALSREWELLYLAVHAARHRWRGLKWLLDIHRECARGSIDWEKVGEKAARFGWREIMRLTLSACHTLLETPIPPQFSSRRLPAWLRLFPADPSPPDPLADALFASRLLRSPAEKLRYLLRVLLVPALAERRLFRLPPSLDVLYYALRPLRIGCKCAGWLLRTGFRKMTGGPAGRTPRLVGQQSAVFPALSLAVASKNAGRSA